VEEEKEEEAFEGEEEEAGGEWKFLEDRGGPKSCRMGTFVCCEEEEEEEKECEGLALRPG